METWKREFARPSDMQNAHNRSNLVSLKARAIKKNTFKIQVIKILYGKTQGYKNARGNIFSYLEEFPWKGCLAPVVLTFSLCWLSDLKYSLLGSAVDETLFPKV